MDCKICGFVGKSLLSHIRNKHGISPDEYKNTYKIEKVHSVSDFQRDKLSKLWKDRFSDKSWKDKYSVNKTSHFTVEYWIQRGFCEDDAKKKISELQSNISKRRDYKKSPSRLTPDFWVKRGHTEEGTEKIISEIQRNFSKKSKRFTGKKHTQESKAKISNRMRDHIELMGTEKWTKHFGNLSAPKYRSKAEIELFLYVRNDLGISAVANDFVLNKYNVDIMVGKKIIEYYGDYWHASELLFEQDDLHTNIGITANEIRKKDEDKIKEIEEAGYQVLVIWENEYNTNPDEVKTRIKNFLV